jgi:type I restriction enzyme, S subunit
MDNMNTGILARLPLPLPPEQDQEDIVNYIIDRQVLLVQAADNAQRQIDLLREYRTRLVADVVTGMLDVRGVELPSLEDTETIEDSESFDETEAEAIDDTEEEVDE